MTNLETTNILVSNKFRSTTDCENIFEQTLRILEELFRFRLVDRISRPKANDLKQQEINHFASKVQLLHDKMYKIKVQLKQSLPSAPSAPSKTKVKSIVDTLSTKEQLSWKKSVKRIQSKYVQILYQGSFKYCNKICNLLKLEYTPALDLINILEWTESCLELNDKANCSLCCC